MIVVDGALVVVEANHGQVLAIDPRGGAIKQLIDISAFEGHIVPTSIAERHGTFYVGNLNLFPIDPDWARVLTISAADFDDDFGLAPGFGQKRGFRVAGSKAGFTTVVDLAFGPDGLLYALELSDGPGVPGDRSRQSGSREAIRRNRRGHHGTQRAHWHDVRSGRSAVCLGLRRCARAAVRSWTSPAIRHAPRLVVGHRPIQDRRSLLQARN